MILSNICEDEIIPFLESLTVERTYFEETSWRVVQSEFVCGARVDGELAGVGYFYTSYWFLPVMGIVVRSQFQRQGLGDRILDEILKYARKRHGYLTLACHHDNTSALYLYRKHGFNYFFNDGIQLWMCVVFNRRGKLIYRLLPLLLRAFYLIHRTPIKHIFRNVRLWWWRRNAETGFK